MDHAEIARKLIGKITPVGESNTDNARFENLKNMCALVKDLIADINKVAYTYKDSHEFSVKRASDYASVFLSKTIGISE